MSDQPRTRKTFTDPRLLMPRRTFLAAGTALAAQALMPVQSKASQSPPPLAGRDPNTLVVLVDATVENLDPATNLEWAYGLQPIYDTLVKLDGAKTLSTVPSLARSLTPNDDASVWTAHLRSGVVFHDGTPCDAEAVKSAIVRLVEHPAGLNATWQLQNPREQVRAVDASTLEISFGSPRPYFNLEAAGQYGYGFASPTAAETHSKGPGDLGSQYLQSNPVGTGPYRLETLEPGQSATFVKNPDYWGGWDGNHFDRIITKTLPVSSTRRQLLEAGEADLVFPLEPEDLLELDRDPRYTVTDVKTFTTQFVSFATDGRLADPRARQAICHAFDHRTYVKDVLLDTGDMPKSVFPSALTVADDTSELLEFDLERAKALFAEAGIEEGTELTYSHYSGFGDTEGQLLQAWLAEIGIKLRLEEKSFSAFIDDFFGDAPADQRADLFYFSWWPNWDHPYSLAWTLFSGDSTSADGNSGRYSNKEANALIDGMYQAQFDDDLTAKFNRLRRILTAEDPAWLPIVEERTRYAMRTDIRGVVVNPIYVSTLDMVNMFRAT